MTVLSGLIIRAGGDEASHVLLLDIAAGQGAMARLVATLLARSTNRYSPWIIVGVEASASEGVISYYRTAPGLDDDHDSAFSDLTAAVPLDRLHLVRVGVAPVGCGVVISDALERSRPFNSYEHAHMWDRRLRFFGYSPELHTLSSDDSILWSNITYATGETGREQVLGWDDIQNDPTWEFVTERGATAIRVPRELLGKSGCADLATALLLPPLEFEEGAPALWMENDKDLFALVGATSVSDFTTSLKRYAVSCGLDSEEAERVGLVISASGITVTMQGRASEATFPLDFARLLDEGSEWKPPIIIHQYWEDIPGGE